MTTEEFKKARTDLGLSQQEFAIKLGYKTFVAISRKENAVSAISAADEIIIKQLLSTSKSTGHGKSRKD